MIRLSSFFRDERGAAAEFALVLPLALLFLFGIMDVGRYIWSINQIEKGVQMGVRYAVVTDIVPDGLNVADFSGITCNGTAITTGSQICHEALGTISCSKSNGQVQCSCVPTSAGNASCPNLGTPNSTSFNRIVGRVRQIAPSVNEANVIVRYAGSGIGYVGDASTSTYDVDVDLTDAAPIVTVIVSGQQFRPMSMLGMGVGMPVFQSSMTLEDGDGAVGY